MPAIPKDTTPINSLTLKLHEREKLMPHSMENSASAPDLFFPEYITVAENSIIGYNTTILAHKYLMSE